MAKRPSKDDYSRVRALLQREEKAGLSWEDAKKKASLEEREAFKRIVESPDA